MQDVIGFLEKLHIQYSLHEHAPVFTTKEAAHITIPETFAENKNLFLRNRKGNRHFLVTISADKKLDLKNFANLVGERAIGFASEKRMMKYLGLTPGSVSPFGLINDTGSHVEYFVDQDLLQHHKIGFHPNINTATVVLETAAFEEFLAHLENQVDRIDLV